MVIDIISYTDEQLAYLSVEQITEVKSAQLKKNALLAKKEKACEAEAFRLQRNGTYRSALYALYCEAMDEEYSKKIAEIREALLFYLRYTSRPEGTGDAEAPYIVNYALSLEERLNIVRTYYYSTYSDAETRFKAFEKDEVAKVYLGELYAPFYSLLLDEYTNP